MTSPANTAALADEIERQITARRGLVSLSREDWRRVLEPLRRASPPVSEELRGKIAQLLHSVSLEREHRALFLDVTNTMALFFEAETATLREERDALKARLTELVPVLERIAASDLDDMNTLHPAGAAVLAGQWANLVRSLIGASHERG